jgi:hypothetical protein
MEHKLSFDLWYNLTGYKYFDQTNEVQPVSQENNSPSRSLSLLNFLDSSTLSDKENLTNSTSLRPEDIPLIIYEAIDVNLHMKSPLQDHLQLLYSANAHYDEPNNIDWVIKNLDFTKEDFKLNGRLAWAFVPAYFYVPDLIFQFLGLYPVSETQTHITWLLLHKIIQEANDELDQSTSDDFILPSDQKSPWHIYTSKAFHAKNKANLIDHIQHSSAWTYFLANKDTCHFTKKNIYDLFIRPLERIFSIDSILSNRLIEAVSDMKERNCIFRMVMTISGFTPFMDDYFDCHYLAHKLSKIRHLSYHDLSNMKVIKTGPLSLISPYSFYDSSRLDILFSEDEIAKIHDFLKEKVLSSDSSFHAIRHFPLSMRFLDLLESFGGRDINMSNQLTILEIFNDLIHEYIEKSSNPSPYNSSPNITSIPETLNSSNSVFHRNPNPSPPLFDLTKANLELHDQRNKIYALANVLSCAPAYEQPEQPEPPDIAVSSHASLAQTLAHLTNSALAIEADFRNSTPILSQSNSRFLFENTSISSSFEMASYKNTKPVLGEQSSKSSKQYSSVAQRPQSDQQHRYYQDEARRTRQEDNYSDVRAPLQKQRQVQQRTKTSPREYQPPRSTRSVQPAMAPSRPVRENYSYDRHESSPSPRSQQRPREQHQQQARTREQRQEQHLEDEETEEQPKEQKRDFAQVHNKKKNLTHTQAVSLRVVPRGRTLPHITNGHVARRISDRELQHRLGEEIHQSDLTKAIQIPASIEGFGTVFWTTTNLMKNVPKWTRIPHSGKTIVNVIDPPFHCHRDHPERYHDGLDLAIFPADDNLYTRDISFTSRKRGSDWFLQIREDRKLKEGTWEEAFIFIHYDKVDFLIDQLLLLLETPLPPAQDMIRETAGTYTSSFVEDYGRRVYYYIDIIQESYLDGWLRMVHISQETVNPDPTFLGDISFPWHEMDFFVRKLQGFKVNT